MLPNSLALASAPSIGLASRGLGTASVAAQIARASTPVHRLFAAAQSPLRLCHAC